MSSGVFSLFLTLLEWKHVVELYDMKESFIFNSFFNAILFTLNRKQQLSIAEFDFNIGIALVKFGC